MGGKFSGLQQGGNHQIRKSPVLQDLGFNSSAFKASDREAEYNMGTLRKKVQRIWQGLWRVCQELDCVLSEYHTLLGKFTAMRIARTPCLSILQSKCGRSLRRGERKCVNQIELIPLSL